MSPSPDPRVEAIAQALSEARWNDPAMTDDDTAEAVLAALDEPGEHVPDPFEWTDAEGQRGVLSLRWKRLTIEGRPSMTRTDGPEVMLGVDLPEKFRAVLAATSPPLVEQPPKESD